MLVEHYRKLRTQKRKTTCDSDFKKEINTGATANADTSIREDRSFIDLQRELIREKGKECMGELKIRKAAGADRTEGECLKYLGGGIITMMVMLYNWTPGKQVHTQEVEGRVSSQPFQETYRGTAVLSIVRETLFNL